MIAAIMLSLCLQAQDRKVQDLQEQFDAMEKRLQEMERKQAQATPANPLNVLNPTITVFGNGLFRLDNKPVFLENDPAEPRIDDTANLREVELDFRAAVDPYVDAVAIIALESETPALGYEAAVEEFYATVKSLPLPFWEEPPLGTKLRLGRLRTEFGRFNRIHLHDLPQINRPLVIDEFMGEEGHVANGASAEMFLPSPGDLSIDLTVQALQGGGIAVAEDPDHIAYLANLRFFCPLAEGHAIDLSFIGFYGVNDVDGFRQSRVGSVDFLYKWKPARQGEWNSFILGAQLIYADHESLSGVDTTPAGYAVWGQYQLFRDLYVGVRYDHTEVIDDETLTRSKIHPYVSWYSSEFFRVRLAYEHTSSDDPLEEDLDTFLLEVNVVFGSHPVEPFWVNR